MKPVRDAHRSVLTPQQRTLVEDNLALVTFTLKRMRFLHADADFDFADLFQTGCIALVKAAALYDPDSGHTFSTYAIACIRGELLRFFRDRYADRRAPKQVPLSLDELLSFPDGGKLPRAELIPDPNASVEQRVFLHRLLIILRDLSAASFQDRVIVQVLCGQIQQKHAMRLLGCSQPTISRHVQHMRAAIQKRLEECHEDHRPFL